MKVKFKDPFDFEGKKYEGIDLNLDALTGRDLINAESESTAIMGRPAIDLDKTYQACIAARAASVPVDMILSLPARDFSHITSEVQSFLLGA